MKIDIVIPVYNEEKSIGNVLKDISKIDTENVSTIIIDDGSDDNTVSVASGFQNTQIFSNKNNRGHGYSVKKGLKIALERKSDIIVTMDGDGQHYAKDISKLVRPIINNEADVVIGSRFHNKENLVGKQVIGVCNFPEKNIAGVVSQVLILGSIDKEGRVTLLHPSQKAEDGLPIA